LLARDLGPAIVAGEAGLQEVASPQRNKSGHFNVEMGQKQTSRSLRLMSALPPKADLAGLQPNVRQVPFVAAGHGNEARQAPRRVTVKQRGRSAAWL
jgi:hypothetical protein